MVSLIDLKCDCVGNFIASGSGFATLRDYARLGVLYMQDGVWDGEDACPTVAGVATRARLLKIIQVTTTDNSRCKVGLGDPRTLSRDLHRLVSDLKLSATPWPTADTRRGSS